MMAARDSLLKQLAPRRRIHRIADLLTADSRRFDLPVTRDAFSLYQFLHDIFCHRTAAYIPMADKKYPHPNASCCFLHHITQSRNRHAISKSRCSHHSGERHARLVFSVQNSTPPNGIILAFHPAGYLNYEELFFILRKLWSLNSPAGIEAVTRRCCPLLPCYLLCLYHSRFSISRNVFFTKCSFAGTKCRKALPKNKKWKLTRPAKLFL